MIEWTTICDRTDLLKQAMDTLRKEKPRTIDAVELRYRDRLTLEQVGNVLGISKERARQLIVNGENMLRKHIEQQCGATV